MKDSWERTSENININYETISIMISQVFRGKRLIKAERTETGLSSGTYKLNFRT